MKKIVKAIIATASACAILCGAYAAYIFLWVPYSSKGQFDKYKSWDGYAENDSFCVYESKPQKTSFLDPKEETRVSYLISTPKRAIKQAILKTEYSEGYFYTKIDPNNIETSATSTWEKIRYGFDTGWITFELERKSGGNLSTSIAGLIGSYKDGDILMYPSCEKAAKYYSSNIFSDVAMKTLQSNYDLSTQESCGFKITAKNYGNLDVEGIKLKDETTITESKITDGLLGKIAKGQFGIENVKTSKKSQDLSFSFNAYASSPGEISFEVASFLVGPNFEDFPVSCSSSIKVERTIIFGETAGILTPQKILKESFFKARFSASKLPSDFSPTTLTLKTNRNGVEKTFENIKVSYTANYSDLIFGVGKEGTSDITSSEGKTVISIVSIAYRDKLFYVRLNFEINVISYQISAQKETKNGSKTTVRFKLSELGGTAILPSSMSGAEGSYLGYQINGGEIVTAPLSIDSQNQENFVFSVTASSSSSISISQITIIPSDDSKKDLTMTLHDSVTI